MTPTDEVVVVMGESYPLHCTFGSACLRTGRENLRQTIQYLCEEVYVVELQSGESRYWLRYCHGHLDQ